jgi:hypothetical protein
MNALKQYEPLALDRRLACRQPRQMLEYGVIA